METYNLIEKFLIETTYCHITDSLSLNNYYLNGSTIHINYYSELEGSRKKEVELLDYITWIYNNKN